MAIPALARPGVKVPDSNVDTTIRELMRNVNSKIDDGILRQQDSGAVNHS